MLNNYQKQIASYFAFLFCIILIFAAINGINASAQQEKTEFPVLMYHSILNNNARRGKYVITPSQLENDFKYIYENGYTTITVSDMEAYVYDGVPLPEKPIMITFDDGYYNNYKYAYPLLKKYGFKAVFSIIGRYADQYSETKDENPNYAHMSWAHLREMSESGVAEIQNHSYDMHSFDGSRKGAKRMQSEPLAAYTDTLTNDIMRLQTAVKEHLGTFPKAYTYPFGFISQESYDILKSLGFICTFSCTEKLACITSEPESLYLIPRFNRPSGISTEDFFKKIYSK